MTVVILLLLRSSSTCPCSYAAGAAHWSGGPSTCGTCACDPSFIYSDPNNVTISGSNSCINIDDNIGNINIVNNNIGSIIDSIDIVTNNNRISVINNDNHIIVNINDNDSIIVNDISSETTLITTSRLHPPTGR